MRQRVAIGALAVLVALVVASGFVVAAHPSGVRRVALWLGESRGRGALVYFGFYAFAAALAFPVVVLSALGGYALGPVLGLAVCVPANAIGATGALLLGRVVLRDWVMRRFAGEARVQALDRAIQRHGLRTAMLVRIAPALPHNLMNYVLSITRIRVRDFSLGTVLGALPVTTLQVFLGSKAGDLADVLRGKVAGPGMQGVLATAAGAVVTVGIVVVLGRFARRELTRMMVGEGDAEGEVAERSARELREPRE